MKQVNSIKDLSIIVENYRQSEVHNKPLLIWFKDNLVLDSYKKSIKTDNTVITTDANFCLSKDTSLPNLYIKGKTTMIVCHRYIDQMNNLALELCISWVHNRNIPVICLVNDYERDRCPNFVGSTFEEIELLVENV